MHRIIMRIVVTLSVATISWTGIASAQTPAGETNDRTMETPEVKRAKTKKEKHRSLRFLKDNRVFVRSQLDLLRLQTKRVRVDDAELLDERFLRLKEMAEAIATARDTVKAGQQLIAQRDLLESVKELGALESELTGM